MQVDNQLTPTKKEDKTTRKDIFRKFVTDMDPVQPIDINRISSNHLYDSLSFAETKTQINDGDDYIMKLHEIKLGDIYIGQGQYYTHKNCIVNVSSKKDCIISHFSFSGKSITYAENDRVEMDNNEFSLFYKKDEQVNHLILPTGKEGGHFFQVTIPKTLIAKLYVNDSRFMATFCNEIDKEPSSYWSGKNLNITFEINKVIFEMAHTCYMGDLKRLFLEAKLLELFVIQIHAYDNKNYLMTNKMKTGDRERIYAVKDYLEKNSGANFTLIELAHMVGINQTKLKIGFKQLFGTTVFGYLTDIRMEKARHLIMNENKDISEVADILGYQYPHHFSVAFKRKFGYSPSKLKG